VDNHEARVVGHRRIWQLKHRCPRQDDSNERIGSCAIAVVVVIPF
jgi:hypothetical protein